MAQATRERSKRDDSGGSGRGVCSDSLHGRLYTIRGLRRSHSGSLFVGSEISVRGIEAFYTALLLERSPRTYRSVLSSLKEIEVVASTQYTSLRRQSCFSTLLRIKLIKL
ncbi:hypothetical protein M404DRAFT_830488 [Pisolithus tinctorius Marx 270]|uniref:Uncharacterized protein n=1 Tax=Pisolithus tinctorius Marx 270 TaxID=870435 RepID=A0A0C3PR52_PISTI|nr:hypothetical protein M404DRAFT_830488 [Pisolithus tinctorius Marx 270]